MLQNERYVPPSTVVLDCIGDAKDNERHRHLMLSFLTRLLAMAKYDKEGASDGRLKTIGEALIFDLPKLDFLASERKSKLARLLAMTILCQDYSTESKSASDEWLEMSAMAATELMIDEL